jgi:uncharacterized protein YeaO (DUF488 family)
MAPRLRTARVYDDPARRDGHRVLVMRLWPRGIRKETVDRWMRDLAPVLPLVRGFLAGRIAWTDYRRRYLAGLKRPEARAQVAEVLALARRRPVTLLCHCADAKRCHRSVLQAYLARRLR